MKLTKRIEVKLFLPGGEFQHRVFRTKSGQYFPPPAIDNLIQMIAQGLEDKYPGDDFRLVEVRPDAFNFVHVPQESKNEHTITGSSGTIQVSIEGSESTPLAG